MRKIISIDTNIINNDKSYNIVYDVIKQYKLHEGDKIKVYQDNEEWDATVTFNENEWGALIKSEARIIPKDRVEGRREGFWEGYYVQKRNILRILKEYDVSKEIIDKINQI